ncbi:hypothetical protein WG66_005671 [Moniliophthora roreri]|nr:hypothetical protein WG66_005671 [Moniliophthora roreri]
MLWPIEFISVQKRRSGKQRTNQWHIGGQISVKARFLDKLFVSCFKFENYLCPPHANSAVVCFVGSTVQAIELAEFACDHFCWQTRVQDQHITKYLGNASPRTNPPITRVSVACP